jgi:glycine hydroxymethyltransferase
MSTLKTADKQIFDLIQAEEKRQNNNINLIPSENFASKAVREAIASVFTHKYSEGNIGKRYYEGNQHVDKLEKLVIDRALEFFNAPEDWSANVQGLSGSNANLAVYLATLKAGDTMMGMYLPDGGHLSHGWSYGKEDESEDEYEYLGGEKKVHITSRLFNTVQYKVDPETHVFDYDEIERLVKKHQPKLLITGGTAYPQHIDYKRMKEIADSVGALYLADIAHEAGLVGAGVIPSPVGIADIVTMTTHKTLRSARGSIILAHKDIIKNINRAVLPGLQGGPFNNNIAGIGVGLGEALQPRFKEYAQQVVDNAKYLAEQFIQLDYRVISGGTEKHLVLVDMTNKGIFGKFTAKALDTAGIVLNMNTMPGETRSPADPSAIRMGTPFVTTQGMKQTEMKKIAEMIDAVVQDVAPHAELKFSEFMEAVEQSQTIADIKTEVEELTAKFPLEI